MKRVIVCLLTLVLAFSFAACTAENPQEEFGAGVAHITIAQANAIATSNGERVTAQKYTVIGTVTKVVNSTYGEMIVADETGELYIYGTQASDGTFYDRMTERPVKGDKIILTGILMTYSGTPQMAAKDNKAVIVDWEHVEVEIDASEYKSATVAQARDAQVGEKLKVDGVVAAIAYANGKIPCGFMLVDETSSIYVFDRDAAMQVAVGNKVEIAASKTYWILDTEKKNAEAFGYQGACQLEEVLLISNDKKTNDYDKSWVEEKTVKQILNTPFEDNITSKLFVTYALVEKQEGTGFVNYYFKDLDGVNSGYTYTQCNGSDFAWLDEFDGKICKVYLTALNAKSAPGGAFYRLLPVSVTPAEYKIEDSDIPAFALEAAVADLFADTYGANPRIALPATYSNEILKFDGVTITYSVDNAELAEIKDSVLNLLKDGTVKVTATATYKTFTASITKEVTLDSAADITTPTIAEIIAKPDGELVQVRGIAMSSLVNRDGLYIGDETGMIAVLTTGEVLATLKPGDEVVFEGYKVHYKKDTTEHAIGQCAIVGSLEKTSDSKLLANYYGDNDYSTSYFDSSKTIDELFALDAMTDYTNNVYTLKAKVVCEVSQYYQNILLQDENGTNKLRLFSSSSKQYSWLAAYEGQVVDLELAVCNWNDKSYYTGCVISVTVDGVKTLNELNFNK